MLFTSTNEVVGGRGGGARIEFTHEQSISPEGNREEGRPRGTTPPPTYRSYAKTHVVNEVGGGPFPYELKVECRFQ